MSHCLIAFVVDGNLIPTNDSPTGATYDVRVDLRAKKNSITWEVGEALKLGLTASPVEGRANEAFIAFFAKALDVPRSSVTIAAGQNSRNKVIRVAGLRAQQVRKLLGF